MKKTINLKNKAIKTKKNIVILCLTKEYYGLGHFRRCFILANELIHFGYKIHFVITKNEIIENELKNKYDYSIIPFSLEMKKMALNTLKILENKNCEWIIIDMRNFGEKISKEFLGKSFHTILLDDAWVKNVYVDILFNGTMVKNYHKYKKINKTSTICTGLQYFILDKLFYKNRKPKSEIINKKYYTVTVSIGGSDPNHVTLLVLKALIQIPKISIKIILGPYSKIMKKISKIASDNNNVIIINSPKKIWNYFKKSDIVISNSGNTLFELATQNVPTLSIAAAKHQIPYAKYFSMYGFSSYLGFWKDLNQKTISRSLSIIISEKTLRKQISEKGSKIIDGKGVGRVTEEIDKKIKSLN